MWILILVYILKGDCVSCRSRTEEFAFSSVSLTKLNSDYLKFEFETAVSHGASGERISAVEGSSGGRGAGGG